MSTLSVSAYARHRGVSHVAVLKAIKSGRIERNGDGTIDVSKADTAWRNNTNVAQQRKPDAEIEPQVQAQPESLPQTTTGGPSYAQSRAVREAYNARLAKLEYEERTKSMVKIDTVKVAWFSILRVLRDRAMNLPDRLAPVLASETDQKVVRDLLEAELRQILDDAADATLTINTN